MIDNSVQHLSQITSDNAAISGFAASNDAAKLGSVYRWQSDWRVGAAITVFNLILVALFFRLA